MKPLDHPTPLRPHRLYFALTNHCNRACPWCSTCSSPRGSTFLGLDDYRRLLPEHGRFEVQLEGGEPTIHPEFWPMVEATRAHPGCARIVLCTNGVVLPRSRAELRRYLLRLGEPLTLKLSVNHHLLDRDAGLLALAVLVREEMLSLGGDRLLVVNVRLRRGTDEDDRPVRQAVEAAGLSDSANFFFLQRYGFASEEAGWDAPEPVALAFTLFNPDGTRHGTDLVGRSEAMRVLP